MDHKAGVHVTSAESTFASMLDMHESREVGSRSCAV